MARQKRRRRSAPQHTPFSSALSDARARLGASQASVAEKLDVEQETVSSWERGDLLPRAHRLPAIAEAYQEKESRLRALWFATTEQRAA